MEFVGPGFGDHIDAARAGAAGLGGERLRGLELLNEILADEVHGGLAAEVGGRRPVRISGVGAVDVDRGPLVGEPLNVIAPLIWPPTTTPGSSKINCEIAPVQGQIQRKPELAPDDRGRD